MGGASTRGTSAAAPQKINDSQEEQLNSPVNSNSAYSPVVRSPLVVYGVSTERRLARSTKDRIGWMLDNGANRHVVNDSSYLVKNSIKSVDFRCAVGNGMTTITAVVDVLLRDRVTCQNILLTF